MNNYRPTERHVQVLFCVSLFLLILDYIIRGGWYWGYTPIYGLLYGIALLPLADTKSILRKIIFVLGSGALSMILAIMPGLYGAGHGPVEPNASGYFTYTSIQKFMVGSVSGALLLAFWVKHMLVPNIKKRFFIFAPIFPLFAVFPMLFIEDFGYWSWYLQVITWWVGFTVAITFSFNIKRANKSLKQGTAQSAAP